MQSYILLKEFMNQCDISLDNFSYVLEKISEKDKKSEIIDYDISIISKILVDTYNLNRKEVKTISNCLNKIGIILGRTEKQLLKKYLDYKNFEDLVKLSQITNIDSETLKNIININCSDHSTEAVEYFISAWKEAEEKKDIAKQQDYILSLLTRIINQFAINTLSLAEIYEYNLPFFNDSLSNASLEKLSAFCDNKKYSISKVRRKFNDFYSLLLREDLNDMSKKNLLEDVMNIHKNDFFSFYKTEDYGFIYININQRWFDKFNSVNSFMDYVLYVIRSVYRLLDNHKAIAVRIGNIYANGKNLKWQLYRYLGIYGEHFIPCKEEKSFYHPEELCIDKASYLGYSFDNEQIKLFKKYFKGSISKENLAKNLYISVEELSEIIMDFDNIWYGYTFCDCISIGGFPSVQNKEMDFIKNSTELLMIFYKYRMDDRKIPCPVCSGLNISGNSFPEIGLRSWECKNLICPERSKSNRGKRYSKKSIFMQQGVADSNSADIISRDILSKWRRDIVDSASNNDIIEMLIKYFSFSGEKILFINEDNFYSEKMFSRQISYISIDEIANAKISPIFSEYFNNGNYIKRYIINKKKLNTKNSFDLDTLLSRKDSLLIEGDSFDILNKFPHNSITAAVTSPPYYNAREYSQWSNLYLYLSDMYGIIKAAFNVLKPGGVFLFNIGDICNNENTVVKSNMGNKRILLGAYSIDLFERAGFELIDNILWDKGEPQSNRHKNDGKFTPHYQKPMNVYEHMLIFKKPGADMIKYDDINNVIPKDWSNNVVLFSPVIKINCNGENTYGHTAPYPEDIPIFVSKVFTNSADDIILDPFAGSGTSIIGAFKSGHKSIGIELSSEYCQLIVNKLSKLNISVEYIKKQETNL